MNARSIVLAAGAIMFTGAVAGTTGAEAGSTCAFGDGGYAENMAIAVDGGNTYFCNENGVWSTTDHPGYKNRAVCIYAGRAYSFNSIIKVGNKTLKCRPGGWK